MATKIQLRRGNAATWTSVNPILSAGEIGYESDTGKMKVGNGISTWTVRPYVIDSSAYAAVVHTHAWADVTGKPATFAPSAHTHDDRYYTEAEVDALVAGVSGFPGYGGDGSATTVSRSDHTHAAYALTSSLAGVATSGAYADLTGKPTIPTTLAGLDTTVTGAQLNALKTKVDGIAAGAEVNVQSDWNAASGDAQILNKPTLGTAAAMASTAFATAAQGTKADSAVQPAAIANFETTTQLNTRDTNNRARANHTGTQSADTLTDGTTNKAFLATERTKLAGIAAGATVNATDAQLRDRATHTGAQAISTVTGLQTALDAKADDGDLASYLTTAAAPELIRDTMGTALVAGANVVITPNDAGDTITIAASGGGGGGGVTDHTLLTSIGTNTHAQIDTHIASTSNPHSVTKAQVGLSNVDNTSDANKPVSTATSTALAGKANTSHTHVATTDLTATGTKSSATYLRGDNTWATPTNTTYTEITSAEITAGTATTLRSISGRRAQEIVTKARTGLTKTDVGLANVDNTSDAAKPVSTATQTALDGKAASVHTHDDRYYTEAEVTALLAAARPKGKSAEDDISYSAGGPGTTYFTAATATITGLQPSTVYSVHAVVHLRTVWNNSGGGRVAARAVGTGTAEGVEMHFFTPGVASSSFVLLAMSSATGEIAVTPGCAWVFGTVQLEAASVSAIAF